MKTKIKLSDGFETTLYKWEVKNPTSIMQIVHGSAEHASRYDHFAKWLNKKGISVWAIDLRGHGELESERGNLGYFGKKGNKAVLRDVIEISKMLKEENKNLPYTLLGHSMGSFIVRAVALEYDGIDKLVVIGTNHENKAISIINHGISSLISPFFPKRKKAFLFDKLSYKAFDKSFKNELPGAWLSKNIKNREEFQKDDLSGFVFTINGFRNMTNWINLINSKNKVSKQNKNIKVLFLAGKNDPVGKMTVQVKKAHLSFKKAGISSKVKLFSYMRHEILNERKKVLVYKEILKFINP